MNGDMTDYDGIGLAQLIRKGEISPEELLEATIDRTERLNPRLNAVVHKMYDEARKAARRWMKQAAADDTAPFTGVPFLLKDLIAECEGAPMHEGSRALKGYVSRFDSELVRRQKAAGLIVVGKTNTPEFGLLPTTEPQMYGPTANPWNLSLTPGGSSGGSAAAVAAGIVPMAHGNDAGGSIRIPASCCGLFGLKPTRGRNTLGPLFGDLGNGLVHEHAITRTVRDSALLLDITSGRLRGDPYFAPAPERPFMEEIGRDPGRLKIGVLSDLPEGWGIDCRLAPECKKAVEEAALLCEDLGHIAGEIPPERIAHPGLYKAFGTLFTCLSGYFIGYWEEKLGRRFEEEELEPSTWASYQAGLKRTGAQYLKALGECQSFSRKIAAFHEEGGYDMILSPTMPIPPTRLGAFQISPEDPSRWAKLSNTFVAFTYVYNITGQPAMSVPLAWNQDGIPIGVQFAAPFGEEGALFRLASQLEQARPWADRKPSIHCSRPPCGSDAPERPEEHKA